MPEDPLSFGALHQSPSDLLTWYLNRTTGPSLQKWPHYFDAYDAHLSRYRNRASTTLLEIGINDGGSLAMWRHFLGKNARIFGADILPTTERYAGDEFYGRPEHIFVGDQASTEFWESVRARLPLESVSIIIDDGGHSIIQQNRTLHEAWPLLAPGGTFVCEDVHGGSNLFAKHVVERFITRPPPARDPSVPAPRLYWGGLRDDTTTLNQFNHPQALWQVNEVQRDVGGVHFYPCARTTDQASADEPERRIVRSIRILDAGI